MIQSLCRTNLQRMSLSTSRRSLNPIPHGAPGVASSMKRPNSGWNTGAVLLSPLSRRQRMFYSHFRGKILLWLAAARQVWHTSTLLQKLCITGQCLENIGLSQGKLDLFVLVVEFYDKILDLVAPEQSIALLSLCVAPNGEQLLPQVSESGHLIRSIRSSIPQCPICAHGSPSLLLPANREAFQWLCNTFRQHHILILASASLAGNCGTWRTANP